MNIKFQKIIALLLAVALSLSTLAACNSETAEKKKKKKKSNKNTATSSDSANEELSGELSTGDFLEEDFDEEEWADEFEEDEEPIEEDPGDEFEEDEVPADAAVSEIKIYNSTPVQTDFLGFNAVYNAFAFRQDDKYGRTLTEKMAKEETRRAAQAGIRIARSTYDVTWAYDSKTQTYNWDSAAMTGLYRFCKEMNTYDISVFLVNQGSNDAFFEHYSWVGGGTWEDTVRPKPNTPHQAFKVEGDAQATLNKFADWMTDTVKALRAHGCYNANYIATQCEPGLYIGDTEDWHYPENETVVNNYLKTRAEQSANLNNAVHRALVKAGLRNVVKIQGANANDRGAEELTPRYVKYYKAAIDEGANDLYGWHTYCGYDYTMDNYEDWNSYYSNFENEVDMSTYVLDEWNNRTENYGITAHQMSLKGPQMGLSWIAMLNHGVRTGYMWSLFDQLWVSNMSNNAEFQDGVQVIGIAPFILKSNIVFPAYYAQSLAGTLVGKAHSTVYRGEDEDTNSVYAAMTVGQDGSNNILVVNMNADDAYLTLDFEKTLGGKTLYRHIYRGTDTVGTSNTDLIGADLKKVNVTTKMRDAIPSYSVVVYTTEKVNGSVIVK